MAQAKNFDTLKYYKILISSGIAEKHAAASTEAMAGALEGNIVTKEYLHNEIKDVRGEIKDVRVEIKSLEDKLTIKFGKMLSTAVGIMIGSFSILITLLGFFLHVMK